MDLTVRAADFSKEECLAWVERWLTDNFTCTALVEGAVDDFAGRSDRADTIIAISEPRTSGDS